MSTCQRILSIYNPDLPTWGSLKGTFLHLVLHSVLDIEKALYASCSPVIALLYTARLPTTGVSEREKIQVES